jgi:hypothetical protein
MRLVFFMDATIRDPKPRRLRDRRRALPGLIADAPAPLPPSAGQPVADRRS